MSENGEPIPYTSEFLVDESYQRSLARGLFAVSFRSPFTWIILAVLAFVVIANVVGSAQQPGLAVIWVAIPAAVYGLLYLRVRRMVTKTFPVGRRFRAGFGQDRFAISDGENSSVLAYSGFDRLDARGDVLWLRRTTPRREVAYPRALFPSVELERLHAAITNAAARA